MVLTLLQTSSYRKTFDFVDSYDLGDCTTVANSPRRLDHILLGRWVLDRKRDSQQIVLMLQQQVSALHTPALLSATLVSSVTGIFGRHQQPKL